MCYNYENASWCDGSKSDYYDSYFLENGENPFGDKNQSNRKCNTNFSQQYSPCQSRWGCDSGLECKSLGYVRNFCTISNNDDAMCTRCSMENEGNTGYHGCCLQGVGWWE